MESNPVVVQAEEAVDASVAAFTAALAGSGFAVPGAAGRSGYPAAGFDDDPLRRAVDGALDVLAGVARSEAKLAALKVQAAAVLAAARKALCPPALLPYEATAQERCLVAEVGCALALGDRAAGALLAESHALTTSLPRTLAPCSQGRSPGPTPGPWSNKR
jgi:hypothetical protein